MATGVGLLQGGGGGGGEGQRAYKSGGKWRQGWKCLRAGIHLSPRRKRPGSFSCNQPETLQESMFITAPWQKTHQVELVLRIRSKITIFYI